MADYSQAWEQYRHRRNRLIIVGLSIFPGWLLFRAAAWFFRGGVVLSTAWGVFILSWFFGTIITSYQAQYCPCPRCGKQFSSRGWHHQGMAFARRCAHCGLPKYANSDIEQS